MEQTSNASASPLLKFTGLYFDEDVDLQWNWHRWYDAATGLWLSVDPSGFAAGDTNLYRYVGNSPLNYTDPSGLDEKMLFIHDDTFLPNYFEVIGESYYNDPTHDNVLGTTQSSLVDRFREYTQEHGLLDLLFIGDHGVTFVDKNDNPTGDHAMRLGNDLIEIEDFEALDPYLSDDAIIILGGCSVGLDKDYCESAAQASGASVCASTDVVTYGGIPIPFSELSFPTRFFSHGKWEMFPAPGVDPKSLPDPRKLHLKSR